MLGKRGGVAGAFLSFSTKAQGTQEHLGCVCVCVFVGGGQSITGY